jgi:membrane-bound lytic murein transglycosylase B
MKAPARRDLLAAIAGALLISLPPPLRSADGFAGWLDGLRRDARAAGVRDATLDRALRGVQPIPRVIELDRHQPEGRMSFAEYRRRVVSATRIDQGRLLRERHAAELAVVRDRFGVPPEIVVALWGVESNFGDFKGKFRVIDSLATLAWDGRRASFFRKELIAALRILDDGHVAPERMFGSWAGAMGQSQFMPTTFLAHAVDADGDGRRDIWDSLPDVFASIANYLRGAGWDQGYRWGREVMVPRSDGLKTGLEHKAPLADWSHLGLRNADGKPLPSEPLKASLVRPDKSAGPAFLVYENFRTLMVWNRSTYFALSVGLLADELRQG